MIDTYGDYSGTERSGGTLRKHGTPLWLWRHGVRNHQDEA